MGITYISTRSTHGSPRGIPVRLRVPAADVHACMADAVWLLTERLVHGPLTALMLLDTTALHVPTSAFKSFEYRAINPIVVNRPVRICGTQEDKETIRVWAEETESNVVGMTGKIVLASA